MADNTPVTPFVMPGMNIGQTPFLQSWNGTPPPFANTQDQIQQALMMSGVYPGKMPQAALGNQIARYAFGRSVPGTSPMVGSQTSFMQNYSNPAPPTGVNLGLLGPSGGYSPATSPNPGPPYGTPYGPGTFPPPGGGSAGPPPAGNPAPPPFPGGAGGAFGGAGAPGGQGAGGGSPGNGLGGGLLGGNRGAWTANHAGNAAAQQTGAAHQQALQQAGMQALQGVSDPATRYMMAMAYRIAPASIGLTNEQINQLEQSTMGSTYNKKTGQVQRNY